MEGKKKDVKNSINRCHRLLSVGFFQYSSTAEEFELLFTVNVFIVYTNIKTLFRIYFYLKL